MPKLKTTSLIIRLCAWCGKSLDSSVNLKEVDITKHNSTHGICHTCLKKIAKKNIFKLKKHKDRLDIYINKLEQLN